MLVINMGIRVKARYEDKVLKPLEGLDLKEGEDVEIEVKRALVEEFHGKMRIDKEIADEIIEMEIWD
jgi:predicted DNA-binding antitoxin AbrB/MazE fold protein